MQLEQFLKDAFARLNDWGRLPSYQLERRVDVFIGHFLVEMIGDSLRLSGPEDVTVVPEFSLPCGRDSKDRRQQHADFLVVDTRSPARAFLIELKMGFGHLGDAQRESYERNRDWSALLSFARRVSVTQRGKPRKRYEYLYEQVSRLEHLNVGRIDLVLLGPESAVGVVRGRDGWRSIAFEGLREPAGGWSPPEVGALVNLLRTLPTPGTPNPAAS